MLTARRIYLYVVSGVALGLLLAGCTSLVSLLLDQLGMGPRGGFLAGAPVDREALSIAIALIAVGLPLWGLHWWFTERLVRRPDEDGDLERRSIARALYLAIVPAVTLWITAAAAADVIRDGIRTVTDTQVWDESGVYVFGLFTGDLGQAGSLALAVVVGVAWAYHVWVRARDARAGPLVGAAAWVSRLYLYGAALYAIFATLTASANLIETGLRMAVDRPPIDQASDWWALAVTGALAQVLVAGVVWAGHWGYSLRLRAMPDWRGAAERVSRVRATYLMAVVLASTIPVIVAVSQGLAAMLMWGLDVGPTRDGYLVAQDMIGPLLAWAPFAVAWWWHRRRAEQEGFERDGQAGARAARRVADYVQAAAGLAFVGVGLARVVGIVLDVAAGSAPIGEPARWWGEELSTFVSFAVVGLPVWLGSWYLCQRRRGSMPAWEAGSTARRAYLFLVVGVTTVAAGISLAWLLYLGIRVALDLRPGFDATETSGPLGVLVIAGLLLAYHLYVLRGDLAVRAEPVPAAAGAPAAVAVAVGEMPAGAEAMAAAAVEATEELVISGPPGADFDAVNATLRERLPAGFSMRVVRHGAGTAG
jgi:hypothetical protein